MQKVYASPYFVNLLLACFYFLLPIYLYKTGLRKVNLENDYLVICIILFFSVIYFVANLFFLLKTIKKESHFSKLSELRFSDGISIRKLLILVLTVSTLSIIISLILLKVVGVTLLSVLNDPFSLRMAVKTMASGPLALLWQTPITIIVILSAYSVFYISGKTYQKLSVYSIYLILLSVGFFIAYISGSRGNIVFVLVVFILAKLMYGSNVKIGRLILISSVALIVILYLGVLRSGMTVNLDSFIYMLAVRFDAIYPNSFNFIDKVIEEQSYVYGYYLIGLPLSIIPRGIWEDKPVTFAQYTNDFMEIPTTYGLDFSSFSESFSNFGVFGILTYLIFTIAIYKYFFILFKRAFYSVNSFVLYSILIFYPSRVTLINSISDYGIIILIYKVILAIILVKLFDRWLRKSF
ncbi:O-antigen polymerase [Pseudocolwellia sp. AS88]|uniref:O-antigen polymerase n=1 Tax=Pseudocolwellia sp. AS88 TaxID=3063958 RepID=UPI0026E9674F|nr:O-antigen polymerase [Pseudocolwellia sp. AS88]MDO7085023.1 O-antigen polymerase [Pseudocolwellia sp. AS88]